MQNHRGLTIVELCVVLAIISLLLAFLLPAVQSVRERARETVCKNNLHQLNLAMGQYIGVYKQLPKPNGPGMTGGWAVEILPFLEQKGMKENIVEGIPIADVPESLFRPPPIMRCPRRTALDRTPDDAMSPSHYVFVPAGRKSYYLFDAPVETSIPWISGPEMSYPSVTRSIGPHSKGSFYASSSQGGGFMLDGKDMK